MLSVIIAAGALFTAVYDVLYKYNTTNTTILNAATVNHTGKTMFSAPQGTAKNCNTTTTLNFDEGTYMMIFAGQAGGAGLNGGVGAVCIAFYKGNSMTVTIGVPGGKGGASDGSSRLDGGGATYVQSNFALPIGTSAGTAIASGAGAGDVSNLEEARLSSRELLQIADGTFAGWEGDGWFETRSAMGVPPFDCTGTPATQSHGGWGVLDGKITNWELSPNYTSAGGQGGGAGYCDGGFGWWPTKGTSQHSNVGGGGSCSPNCYSLSTSDAQVYPKDIDGNRYRGTAAYGYGYFIRIDPEWTPEVGEPVIYGGSVSVDAENKLGNRYNPREWLSDVWGGVSFDCGIKVGWVYSCSEDGEKWGAGSERKCRRHLKFNTARCYSESVNRHFLSE